MRKDRFVFYSYMDSNLTRMVMDSIVVGDYVWCNQWEKPMLVIAVSPNYFIAIRKCHRTYIYTIFEKVLAKETKFFKLEGMFSFGPDNEHGAYSYIDLSQCERALERLECGLLGRSINSNIKPLYHGKTAVSLETIGICKSKWDKGNIQEFLDKNFVDIYYNDLRIFAKRK